MPGFPGKPGGPGGPRGPGFPGGPGSPFKSIGSSGRGISEREKRGQSGLVNRSWKPHLPISPGQCEEHWDGGGGETRLCTTQRAHSQSSSPQWRKSKGVCWPGDCRRCPPPGLPCTQLTSQPLPNELRIRMAARPVGRPPGGTRNPLYRPVKRFHYLATFLHHRMETTTASFWSSKAEKPWPSHRKKRWSQDFCWTLGS